MTDVPTTPMETQAELANRIWSVLVDECGASNDQHAREDFVRHVVSGRWTEYRFCGALRFGGKVWNRNPPYVSYYPEDRTPGLDESVERANTRLVRIFAKQPDPPLPPKKLCTDHTPDPSGYVEWHDWAKKMSRTHRSTKCKDCGLYAIWVKKKPRKTRKTKVVKKKAKKVAKKVAKKAKKVR